MAFSNFQQTNNASATLAAGISNSATTLSVGTGQGSLFPSSYPYMLKLETIVSGNVTYRELVKCTNRSGDTMTIVRSAGACPANSTATTQTTTAFSFGAGDTVSLTMTAEQIKDMSDEIARLGTAKLNATGGAMTGLLSQAQGANIASATTTDLATATGNEVHITGTTTITGLGTVSAGTQIVLVFDGALTLTYNATSLILPGLANIVTTAGDCAIMVSEGGGNWRCVSYRRADGSSVTTKGFSSRLFAYPAGNQTSISTTPTKVVFDTELFDDSNEFASNRFTATVAGYYHVDTKITWQACASGNAKYLSIYKNGAAYATDAVWGVTGDTPSQSVSSVVYLAANDYIEVFARYHTTGGALYATAPTMGGYGTYLSIHRLS